MYIIRRIEDGMWLMATMRSACPAPTCLWGLRRQDAKVFVSRIAAEGLAGRCGGEVVAVKVRTVNGEGDEA